MVRAYANVPISCPGATSLPLGDPLKSAKSTSRLPDIVVASAVDCTPATGSTGIDSPFGTGIAIVRSARHGVMYIVAPSGDHLTGHVAGQMRRTGPPSSGTASTAVFA